MHTVGYAGSQLPHPLPRGFNYRPLAPQVPQRLINRETHRQWACCLPTGEYGSQPVDTRRTTAHLT